MGKINLNEKFALIDEYWKPKIVGELNNQQVSIVKIKGEFVFHKHEIEDELFMVIKGFLKMEFENRFELLTEGEIIIIPRGIVHRPVAENEAHLVFLSQIQY